LLDAKGGKAMRALPRARLPHTYIGAGVSQAILDGHLLNLRKERDVRTGREEWVDKVENHMGLAKVYARLAVIGGSRKPAKVAFGRVTGLPQQNHAGNAFGLGKLKTAVSL